MPYEHHQYLKADGNFNEYPEQINPRWCEAYTTNTGEKMNQDRIPWPAKRLHPDFQGYYPRSRRSDLPTLIPPLSDAVKREIRENATTREDFHDQDKIHHFGRGVPQPFCLCELRIITRSECTQHLVKGPDGKTIGMPGNMHWAWYIDTAPRGWVCPQAWRKDQANLGDQPGKQGCDILIDCQPPSEEWVLAQMAEDPVGTPAGRAVTDILVQNSKCPACSDQNVDPDTHQWIRDERNNYKYYENLPFPRQFMEYKPFNSVGKRMHPMLSGGLEYHEVDLLKFPGVTAEDIWVPYALGGRGCYLDKYRELLAAEQAAQDEDGEEA